MMEKRLSSDVGRDLDEGNYVDSDFFRLYSQYLHCQNGRRANAKSLLGVLSLGISDGDHLEISVDGSDGAAPSAN